LSAIDKTADNVFALSGDLDRISLAGPMNFEIFNSVATKSSVTISMQAVRHCDTAGLAWVINLLKYLSERDISWILKDVPETLSKLAKISDLDDLISAV
jgi:phospholipid transport system transporter-binding protein